MQRRLILCISCLMLISLGALLLGCGSSTTTTAPTGPLTHLVDIGMPTPYVLGTTATYAWDIAAISGSKFYLTDRTNKVLDVVAIPTSASGFSTTTAPSFILPGAFTGCQGGSNTAPYPVPSCASATTNNDLSGPDGLNVVGSLLYVGDVDRVKIVDPSVPAIKQTIDITPGPPIQTPAGLTGFRADEGCYDPDDNLFMINTPGLAFSSIITTNTTTPKVAAYINYADTAAAGNGLEACAYDHATRSFYNNNDGSSINPHGEVDVITAADILAISGFGGVPPPVVDYSTFAHLKRFPEGLCDPTGLALGNGNDLGVNCLEGTTGQPLLFYVFDKTAATGTGPVATLNAGGGDQVWYDPTNKAFYNVAGHWTATGKAATNGACSATSPCTPVLFVISSAGANSAITNTGGTPIGNGAHSIAVDPTTGLAFIPFSAASSSCTTCSTNGFAGPGTSVFTTR